MARPSPLEAFVWGKGGAAMSPEEIAREREIAAALMSQGADTSPIGHWSQGAARVVNALGGVMKERRAGQAETANAGTNSSIVQSLLGGGTSGFPQAPSPSSGASPMASLPSGATDLKGGIEQTAAALGIDPVDLATAISYETGDTFDPMQKGPTTQWGQHKGLIQFGEPQAQQFGVDWNDPVGSQLGPDGAVAKYLRSTGVKPGMGLMDIYSAINAGGVGRYDRSDANNGGAPGTVADKVNKQMAGHRAKALALFGGNQVASNDPQAAIAMGLSGQQQPIQSIPDPFANNIQGQDITPPEPSQQMAQDLSQVPVMAGGTSGALPAGQQGFNPAIIEALSNPAASEQTKKIAGMLLGQQMEQNNPANQLDMDYKRAQIDALGRKGDGSDETFFGNPVAIQGPDGGVSYGQMGNRGTFRPIQLPEGQSFAPPTKTIDTGTEMILLDQAGNVIFRTPKQNFQEAYDTGAGGAAAKADADTEAELGSISSKMPGLYSVVDRLQELSGGATYTSAGKAVDWARKEAGMEPRDAAVARAEYTAIIDNQILPLLRDTFGAQFTAEEGQRLARTLGDPDKSPTEKQALLRAFIQQKERDIQALETRSGKAPIGQTDTVTQPKRLKFNPATGELE